jgi:hypothetical protein
VEFEAESGATISALESFRRISGRYGVVQAFKSGTNSWQLFGDLIAAGVNFSNVQLLLLGEGADLSTTITDSSSAARTPAAISTTAITTSTFPFGISSINFDGTNSMIRYADSADFDVAANEDFCLELHLRLTTDTSDSGNNRGVVTMGNSFTVATPSLFLSTDAAPTVTLFTGSTRAESDGITLNTWTHFAWYRVSGVHYLAVGGTVGSSTWADTSAMSPTLIRIGATISDTVGNFQGQMKNIRFIVGESPYGADNFTPPSDLLPTS